ncbi:response regulator [Chitinophaga sp. 22536]|uniref:response regulator n=1 Tax=unclassified Chitinophaga TaxID=2619133 RepID=UPI003F84F6D8
MKTTSISVIIVEDHVIVAEGLNSILSKTEGIQLTGVFPGAEEALLFLEKQDTDLVLLDISLPAMSGHDFCRLVKSKYADIKVIALTNHTEKSVILEMLDSGADGYLLKNISRQELVEAIFQVIDNRFTMHPALQQIIFSPGHSRKSYPRLTTREREILQLVGTGITTHAIADQLSISTQTVDTHRRNLMQKFNVGNAAALIKKAVEAGLL